VLVKELVENLKKHNIKLASILEDKRPFVKTLNGFEIFTKG